MTTFGPTQAGATGPAGEDFGVDFLYESTVGTSNPGSGRLGLNDADHSLATTLVLSETDAGSVNVAGWLGTLDDSTSATKGQLWIRGASDPTVYRLFSVTATTDSGTYWTLTVSLLDQNGSLSDDDPLKVAFLPKGDKGDTGSAGSAGSAGADGKTVLNGTADPTTEGTDGDFYIKTSGTPANWKIFGPKASGSWPAGVALQGPAGATGSTGATGATGRDAGWNYIFNSATSGDPGSGKFLSTGSALHFSETDADGNALAFTIANWGHGTEDLRGYLEVRKVGSPSTFRVYSVLGSITDAGSYATFTFGTLSSGGTLSNGDVCTVSYRPSGLVVIGSGGSASAPGLPVNNNSNTGLLADTTDQLAITAGGTEQVRFGATYGVDIKAGGLKISAGPRVRSTSTQQLTGGTTYNDLAVTPCESFVITSTGAGNITINNIAMSVVDGLELVVLSRATVSVVLKHATTGTGTATNSFANDGAADITLTTNQKAHLLYSTTANRWILSRLG